MNENDESRRAGQHEGATLAYQDLIRSALAEWDRLEASGDSAVQMSGSALAAIKESVRADARHGSALEMPPTEVGPFTVTELAVRTLVRATVDAVPGTRSLRNTITLASADSRRAPGTVALLSCRISASWTVNDLPALAERVRLAVRRACYVELGVEDLPVDVHIEDLHD